MPASWSRVVIVVFVVAALLALAAPSIGDTKRFRAAGAAGSWRWEPDVRRITKGDRIVWRNPTNSDHTVTAYAGRWSKDTRIEADGGRTSKRFRRTGMFKFRCLIGEGTPAAHSTLEDGRCSGMCGKVRVRRG